MVSDAFFEKIANADFPNDRDRSMEEAIMRFIQEDVTEENINSVCYEGKPVFGAIFKVMRPIFSKEGDRKNVENIIDALLRKKGIKLTFSNFKDAIIQPSPIILDTFLKKITPLEKAQFFSELFLDSLSLQKIQDMFFDSPENIRILISHGLPYPRFISNFKNYHLRLTKMAIPKDFPTPSESDSKEYREFYNTELVTKIRPEIMRRFRLSLMFPSTEKQSTLDGISFNRDGGSFPQMFSDLQRIFQHYSSLEQASENKELKEYFLESSERKKILQEVLEILSAGNTGKDNRVILVGTKRMTPDGSMRDHAEGLLVFNDLLIKINRGARSYSQDSGVTIFQRSSTIPEMETYLSTLRADIGVDGSQFDGHIASMVKPEPLLVLHMKGQKVGNCTWTTSKAFVQAVYFVIIRDHLIKQHQSKNETVDEKLINLINQQAASIAKAMYKDFSRTQREQEIKEYIEIHAKDNFKFADEEILMHMIAYAFSIKGEILEKVKGTQELRNLIVQKPQKFLMAAVKTDDSDLIRFVLGLSRVECNQKVKQEILKTAILKNALKIISHFETLFGSLKGIEIDSRHPVLYAIEGLGSPSFDLETVRELFKHCSSAPYTEIIQELKNQQSFLKRDLPHVQSRRLNLIRSVQELCCEQLIQELNSEALKILAKEIDSKQKREEINILYKAHKDILGNLVTGLPDAEVYQKKFEAMFNGHMVVIEQDNTTALIHYEEPSTGEPLLPGEKPFHT